MGHGSDRRAHARYEIVGHVWGTLEAVVGTDVRNIGVGGALVESPVQLAIDSAHQISLTRGELQVTVHARVRHTRPTEDGQAYLVGFEFAALPAGARTLVAQAVPDPT